MSEGPEVNPDLRAMQHLKESAQEFVRCRSSRVAADPGVAAISGAMRAMAKDWWQDNTDDAPRNLGLVTGGGEPDSVSLSPPGSFSGLRSSVLWGCCS